MGWQPRVGLFMEMGNEFDQLDFELQAWQGPNYPIIREVKSAFICPSDPHGEELHSEENFAAPDWVLSQTDYAGCMGDYQNTTGVGATPGYGNVGEGSPVRGMMGRYSWSAKFRDVTDGLSNTICVGECVGAFCIIQNFGVQSYATTAHPINHMNASLQATKPTKDAARWDESIAFRSFHPGGAMFEMGDGSVRFLSESIDGTTYRALASRAEGEVLGEF